MHRVLVPLLLVACGSDPAEDPPKDPSSAETETPAPPADPVRVRLFDRMDEAVWELPDETSPAEAVEPFRVTYDFDDSHPDRIWFGRRQQRKLEWDEEPLVAHPEAGRSGGGLKLGPGVPEDFSRAAFVVPCEGPSRVRIQARVRLEGNPDVENASTRECLRLIEHGRSVDRTDPSRARGFPRPDLRLSRKHDPSGWWILSGEHVTDARTRCLEVNLLHRSGESEESYTVYDDVELEVLPLTPDQVIEHISSRYRPGDGQENLTPWRIRVGLDASVRDAVLLPAPASLVLPLDVPAASHAPRLRFQTGVLGEARRFEGDGVELEVAFRPGDGGEEVALGGWMLDVRRERDHRGWLAKQVDLTPVAGRSGWLVFRTVDVDDEPDLDPVLIATPRVEPAHEAPRGMNVLLIGVDTLRADRMSAFGYERDTTPHLLALGEAGVRFTQTRAQAPWTLPSFSSTLTSLYPSVHNAGRGGHDVWTPIDPSTTSLAEVLSRVGYETVGHVANFLISPRYGLDQGFESYTTGFNFESAAGDAEIVADFVAQHTTTPWLMFWHIMDPHLPYTTEESYRETFTDGAYGGRFQISAEARERGRAPSVPFQVLDPRPGRRWFTHEGPPPLPDLSEEDVAFVADYYDAEIAEMDAAVGRVLRALKDSGQWERTIVAFVADHGEGLGDHDHYHHGYTLFDDQIHIPMILRVPGAHEGRVIDRPVAAIDLAPTLLGAMGLPIPDSFQGVDRLAQDAPSDDAFFVEYPTYDSSAQKAWISGSFKYLHDPVFHTEALYDFIADPAERTDIAAEHPEVVARARAALDAFRWEQLQVGRFHLRVRGRPGQQLSVRIETDDLFDANFVARPAPPEEHFAMDLGRSQLALNTTLESGQIELVFWGRGTSLDFTVELDGAPVEDLELPLPEESSHAPTPVVVLRDTIPSAVGADLRWPAVGGAQLWLEAGAREMLPVENTPEEIEALRTMGYAR